MRKQFGLHFRRLEGADGDGSGILVDAELAGGLGGGGGGGGGCEASEANNFDGALFAGLVETTGGAAGSASNGDPSRTWTLRACTWNTCRTRMSG